MIFKKDKSCHQRIYINMDMNRIQLELSIRLNVQCIWLYYGRKNIASNEPANLNLHYFD